MIPPSPVRPKDFTVVKRDGLFHMFYIRNDTSLPPDSTQRDFGHAVSADLYGWTQLDPVIAVNDSGWDRDHVWAPSIVERDSVYYMFYTGVANQLGAYNLYQRIGIATSTDLMQWNRMDVPVLTCFQVPWSHCDSLNFATAFRDPFVMADPTTPGRWLMLYSVYPDSDPDGMVAGVATSDGDFTQWADLKPLWITHRNWTFNDIVESPHLFEHAGLWYLFFTTSSGQPLSFATSQNPLSEPPGWQYRGRLSTMLGYNTSSWYASEQFSDGTVDYFAYVNGDRIEIERIQWGADWQFLLTQPDAFHVLHMTWANSPVMASQPDTLVIESTWWGGQSAPIEAFEVDPGGVETPIPLATLGLPAQIPLDGAISRYAWVAQGVPDGDEDGPGAEIVIRLLNRTCEASPITVLPDTTPPDTTPLPPPPPPPPPEDPLVDNIWDALPGTSNILFPKLRTLRRNFLSSQPSLLADLPEESRARLDVFDVQGRRVRTLVDRVLPRGATVVAWDGRDEAGMRAARGIYFARLTTPRAVRTARVLLLE